MINTKDPYRLNSGRWIIARWNVALSRFESDDFPDRAGNVNFMWASSIEKLASFGPRKYRAAALARAAMDRAS